MSMNRNLTYIAVALTVGVSIGQSGLAGDETSQKPVGSVLTGENGVNRVVFSPDGKLLAAAEADGKITIWIAGSWQTVQEFQPKTSALSLAFSKNGRLLAYGGKGSTVYFWDIANKRVKHKLRGPNKRELVRGITFSPDGRLLAYADGKAVRLADVNGDEPELLRSGFHRDYVNDVAFSPDGKRLVSASRDGVRSFVLWDVTSKGLAFADTVRRSGEEAWAVAFAPDGKNLIVGDGFAVYLLRPDVGEWKATRIGGHRGGNPDVRKVAVAPNGALVASLAVSDGFRLWNLKSRKPTAFIPDRAAFAIAFSPDGRWLATGGA